MKNANKKTLSYTVFYQTDPEGGYVAFAPFLPGCHSQGDTLEEAEMNIKEAIELYLESLAEHGENFPIEEKTFSGEVKVLARSL
ncbi:MAG: type II toxin-antitoxin system HicB family antitoxin [Candidatus Pacebacteria bacterium]|nr:type II toxin-antitoxin system HicB family antitoxin [Candidatus Paceibacterota bacterium]NUQ56935.1 type II toxin-antitoxin system HicB family antitoxin [Candidatus Paceibacter sp.]